MNTNHNSFPMPPIDLTGKLIIKAQLGSDIRKIPIHNEEITYDELLLMMQRLFAGKIRSSDEITIKYKDEDGDMITLFDSSDLIFAKSLNRYLKLTLFVNGKPQPLQHDEVKEVKSELIEMRDKINDLLSRIDSFANGTGSVEALANGDGAQETEKADEASLSESFANQATIQPDASVNKVNAALFDPLTNQSESIESSSAPDPFAGVGPSEQSSSYPPQPKQQPPQQLNVYPSSASQYNMSQNQEPKMSYPNNQSSQSMPMPSQPSYQQNVPQQQQQQPQQQQQQQQQQYPQASQPYQPQQQQQPQQPQQQMQNTQNSYASQGQQLNTYPGYPTSDPNQYGGQGAGNPYRTMSPSQGRYPQPMQGYDYRSNPVAAQQISSAPNSLGYPGPGFK